MASTSCWRCLLRPSLAPAIPRRIAHATTLPVARAPVAAPFSSTAQLYKKKVKKKRVFNRGKSVAPGERKAFRKRIVLTNDNALNVTGLDSLTKDNMVDLASAGRMLRIPEPLVDQLRVVEAFKATQCWHLFRWPHVLLRDEAVDLFRRMQTGAKQEKTLRMVITGDKTGGKSVLLLQAMANAYLNNWVVIHIPEAQELTTACTDYGPVPGSDPEKTPELYMQPAYAQKLIRSIQKANETTLSAMNLVHPHPELSGRLPERGTVLQLMGLATDLDHAWPVFTAMWKELTTHGQNRRPILFALDGLAHIMKLSAYRSPSFELIHSHDLALVRLFTDCLSGALALPNGGAVIGATSLGNSPRSPSMELALDQRLAEQASEEDADFPRRDPYFRGYDDRVEAVLRDVEVLHLGGLSKAAARPLVEYWAASGLLRATVDEAAVTQSWTLGGSGVVGEMERASLLTMRL